MNPGPSPLVSVVMPVRNGGNWLQPAVDSVLAQTLSDFELLIVDDGSTDKAIAGLLPDPRIRILPCIGRGIVDALNTGIGQARAEYIARMDADDLCKPDRLRSQLDFLERFTEVDLCGCRVEVFSEFNGQAVAPGAGITRYVDWVNALVSTEQLHHHIYVESPVPHPGWFVRASLYQALGGYQQCQWAEDYDFLLRAHQQGYRFGKVDQVLLGWRDSDSRVTRTDHRCSLDAFMRCRCHYLAVGPAKHRQVVILGAGATGAALADHLLAQQIDVTGFVDVSPRRIGGVKRERPVWGPGEITRLPGNTLYLGAAGSLSVRNAMRDWAQQYDLQEGIDLVFVS